MLGSDPGDIVSQKRWLAFLEGGLLPIISLTSLHFFTKYDRTKSDKEEVVVETPVISEPDKDLTEEQYEKIMQDFIKKQNEEAEKIKYTPKEEDFEKLDEFLSKIGYDGPKKVEIDNATEFVPNEDELKKIEEVLSNYSKPNVIEVEEELYSDDKKEEVEEQPQLEAIEDEVVEEPQSEIVEEEEEPVEIKPEPVDNVKTYKVLNYFKSND
jgi:hypothetical protein